MVVPVDGNNDDVSDDDDACMMSLALFRCFLASKCER